jgi:hypothetical protein
MPQEQHSCGVGVSQAGCPPHKNNTLVGWASRLPNPLVQDVNNTITNYPLPITHYRWDTIAGRLTGSGKREAIAF